MPRPRGPRTRVATGVYRDAIGCSVVVMVAGEQHERRYPAGTSLDRLLRARDELREHYERRARRRQRAAPKTGTLAAEAVRYLAAVRAMPSYPSRRRLIELWVGVLGTRRLASLDHLTIAAQLQTWATTPRSATDDRPYSAQYLVHLRGALSHLYATIDPDGDNPVARVPRARVVEPLPRAIPLWDLVAILRAMPRASKARARLAVMASTGVGPAELARLRRQDIDVDGRVLVAHARRKGKGSEARAIPLTRHAVRALHLLLRLDALGPFSTSNLRRAFRVAAARAGYVLRDADHPDGLDWRPYDVRHTFGSLVGEHSRDERAVQALLGHTDRRTTRRYTGRSIDPRVAAAMAALESAPERVPGSGARNGRQKLAQTGRNCHSGEAASGPAQGPEIA